MKTKTLTSISACLLMALSIGSFAQTPSMPQVPSTQQAQQGANQVQQNAQQQAATASSGSFVQKAQKEVTKMSGAVSSLNDDQKNKLKQTFTDFYTQRAQNKVTAGGDAAKLKQLNRATAKSKMASIKSILTPEQLATWKQSLQQKASAKPGNLPTTN